MIAAKLANRIGPGYDQGAAACRLKKRKTS